MPPTVREKEGIQEKHDAEGELFEKRERPVVRGGDNAGEHDDGASGEEDNEAESEGDDDEEPWGEGDEGGESAAALWWRNGRDRDAMLAGNQVLASEGAVGLESTSTEIHLSGSMSDLSQSLIADMAQRGRQTDTVHFAEWEAHTRGTASKMMAAMGFQQGMGLGKAGQGVTVPVHVQLRPQNQALGFEGKAGMPGNKVGREGDEAGERKKRKRGGQKVQKKRQQAVEKEAAAAEAAAAGASADVFDFINSRLHGGNGGGASSQRGGMTRERVVQAERHQEGNGHAVGVVGKGEWRDELQRKVAKNEDGRRGRSSDPVGSSGGSDRRALLKRQERLTDAEAVVVRLQQMAQRNAKDPATHAAIVKKLKAAQEELRRVKGNMADAHNEVTRKEAMKKWAKF